MQCMSSRFGFTSCPSLRGIGGGKNSRWAAGAVRNRFTFRAYEFASAKTEAAEAYILPCRVDLHMYPLHEHGFHVYWSRSISICESMVTGFQDKPNSQSFFYQGCCVSIKKTIFLNRKVTYCKLCCQRCFNGAVNQKIKNNIFQQLFY